MILTAWACSVSLYSIFQSFVCCVYVHNVLLELIVVYAAGTVV
jgi:hypothetical protein